MTEPNDELMERLAAADPVDPTQLPSADDAAATNLLETIMSTTANPSDHETDHDVAGFEAGPTHTADLPEVEGIDRYRPRKTGGGRSRGWLVAATAAVAALLAGFILFSPDNTSPALAAVQSAAQTTADFDSGRVTTDFSADGSDGVEEGQISGQLAAEFSGENVAVSVTDLQSSEDDLSELTAAEGRLVDGVLYANDGSGQWLAVETGGFIGQQLVDFVDPRTVLTTVQDLVEAEEVGPATVDGVDVTHYQSVIDLADESLTQSGWLALQGISGAEADIEAEGEVTVDLYIDSAGVLRQFDLTGDVQEPEGGDGAGTFSVVTKFFDLGGDITVEAPADAEVVDPLGQLEGDLDLGD